MRTQLTIYLEQEDIDNINHVLPEIANAIEEGFTSGIKYPVNWGMKECKSVNTNIQSIQNSISDLQADTKKKNRIIESLENWKVNE
jgi:hypothetical protein